MARLLTVLLLTLGAVPGAAQDSPASASAASSERAGPVVYTIEFEEAVQPISAEFLVEALGKAEEAGAALFLIRVNTPGGLVSSTQEILDALLGAEVPVVYWVAPAGAMAASAGFIIGLAADVVAAAPGTSIGAASVVGIGGAGGEEGKENTGLKKMHEILGAQVRSMAEARGRDPELAAKAVFEAKAWSAEEAEEAGLVDLLAATREELLEQLDGRTVRRFDGEEVVLDLEGYTVETIEMSWRRRALNMLADPNISYILLLVGMFGVMMELYNPGTFVPGIIGVIALILFGFTVQILPISVIGVILVAISIAFFIAEVKITSYGLLTVGGILCLVLGGLMLVGDEAPEIPQFQVDPWLILGVSLTFGVATAFGLALVVRAHRSKITTGAEGLVDESGTAVTDLEPKGKVYVHGEYWDAVARRPIPEGARIRVAAVKGLELEVEPEGGEPRPLEEPAAEETEPI